MALTICQDCQREISTRAEKCPNCGAPVTVIAPEKPTLDVRGTWCPNCHNRDSVKKSSGLGCLFIVAIFFTLGLALLAIPFRPKHWYCRVCKNEWKA